MIATLTGSNDFLRKRELDRLVAAFVAEHGDMAIERLEGEEASAERLRESVESVPFLSSRKLVVLQRPGLQKAFAENIETILQAMAETTDAIIVEPKLDKRLSYYKILKKQTDFREFNELDANALAAWACNYAKEQGGNLSSGDARQLVERLGPNQQLLLHELDKLLLYDPHITAQTIELLTERLPQSTIFELIDAALNGNVARALALYREQRALKVEPLAIIALLTWQLHLLALIKTPGNRPADEIAKTAKLSPFVVRKSQQLARKLSAEQIKQSLADLLQLDQRLKTTATDADEALAVFLLKLA